MVEERINFLGYKFTLPVVVENRNQSILLSAFSGYPHNKLVLIASAVFRHLSQKTSDNNFFTP
jgi:hypothetical protein